MTVLSKVMRNDRKWFSARPNRRFRLRPPLTGEAIGTVPDGLRCWIAVEQIAPGVRMRAPLVFPMHWAMTAFDTDANIERMLARKPGHEDRRKEVELAYRKVQKSEIDGRRPLTQDS